MRSADWPTTIGALNKATALQIKIAAGALDDRFPPVGRIVGLDEHRAGQRVARLQRRLRTAQHFDLLHIPQAARAAPRRSGFCVAPSITTEISGAADGFWFCVRPSELRPRMTKPELPRDLPARYVRLRVERLLQILDLLLADLLAGHDADTRRCRLERADDLLALDDDTRQRCRVGTPGAAALAPPFFSACFFLLRLAGAASVSTLT